MQGRCYGEVAVRVEERGLGEKGGGGGGGGGAYLHRFRHLEEMVRRHLQVRHECAFLQDTLLSYWRFLRFT